MPEDLNAIQTLTEEIERLRDGEEGGQVPEAIPTPGQFLKRLHELDTGHRMMALGAMIDSAEAGWRCANSLHEANLSELRQRAMNTWSILHRISEMCRDPERDGIIHVSEINELLPDGLRS